MTTPDSVARIAEQRDAPAFVELLREADAELADAAFEPSVADVPRVEPGLIDLWVTWSADQRWTPSAYVQGRETGWYDSGYQNVRTHLDEAGAVADFIHRMAAWLARRHVTTLDPDDLTARTCQGP